MIAIVDYGMGNSGSIANMLQRIGVEALLSSDLDRIASADKLILPGVGAFDAGIARLRDLGMVPVLEEKVLRQQTPILGICLGMQIFAESSEEGSLPGLGWIAGRCRRLRRDALPGGLRVPHMGWNTLDIKGENALLAGLPPDARFYFVHSYHLNCSAASDVLAVTTYGLELTAVVARGTIFGTQFHPEKSLRWGMQLMRNFARHA